MGSYTWILDPGHGGLGPGGEYLTPGKRSPMVPPGFYEGEFNRDIAKRVVGLCKDFTDLTITNPGPANMGLKARTEYARALHKVRKNCVFVSIHANAMGNGKDWTDAHGATVFHHPKDERGKELAMWMLDSIDRHTSIDTTRGIKSRRFTVLSRTRAMPSVLVECGFMTHWGDAHTLAPRPTLATRQGRVDMAYALSQVIEQFELTGGL